MNVDATVGKNARIAIDPANAGVGGDNSFQAFSCYSSRHCLCFSLFFDGDLAFAVKFRAAPNCALRQSRGKDVYNLAIPSLSRNLVTQRGTTSGHGHSEPVRQADPRDSLPVPRSFALS